MTTTPDVMRDMIPTTPDGSTINHDPISVMRNISTIPCDATSYSAYQFAVENMLSDDAIHGDNVEEIISRSLEEGVSAKECARQCEIDILKK